MLTKWMNPHSNHTCAICEDFETNNQSLLSSHLRGRHSMELERYSDVHGGIDERDHTCILCKVAQSIAFEFGGLFSHCDVTQSHTCKDRFGALLVTFSDLCAL